MKKEAPAIFQNGVFVFPAFHPHALAAFSSREFEASRDLPFFLKTLGVSPENYFTVRQVHGARVVRASGPGAAEGVEADGIVTDEKNLALVLRTADCVPVFLFDPDRPAAGLAHAGWRGAHKGIIQKTVQALKDHFGSRPSRFQAALGPAICESCYEVGEEFQNYFPGFVRRVSGKIFFDLVHFVKHQLVDEGIPESNVTVSGFCTSCSVDRFFSARREGQETGRFLSAVVIK